MKNVHVGHFASDWPNVRSRLRFPTSMLICSAFDFIFRLRFRFASQILKSANSNASKANLKICFDLKIQGHKIQYYLYALASRNIARTDFVKKDFVCFLILM